MRRVAFAVLQFGTVEAALALGFAGFDQAGWTILLFLLLGFGLLPPLLIEGRLRGNAGAALGAALSGVVAAVVLAASVLQVSYTHAIVATGSFARALGEVDAEVRSFDGRWPEVRLVLSLWAAPFAFVTLGRLLGLRAIWQVLLGLGASLVVMTVAPSWIGFVGLPIPGWLIRAAWLNPRVATFLMGQPLVAPFVLVGVLTLARRDGQRDRQTSSSRETAEPTKSKGTHER
jgi:hypothetical protein